MGEGQALLRIEDLDKSFGGLAAINHVTLTVGNQVLHSIIGPNGAGKTTLFNLVTGHLPSTRGRILFLDEDITHLPIHAIAQRGLARVFQRTSIFPNLTVLENVRVSAQAHSGRSLNMLLPKSRLRQPEEEAYHALEMVGLAEKAKDLARTLAHGDQRLLEMAITLGMKPRLLLLDEPTVGMSVAETGHMAQLIRNLSRTVTVLLVEHDMDVVMNVSDVITVLHFGSIIAEGTPDEIRANAEVQRAYLGGLD